MKSARVTLPAHPAGPACSCCSWPRCPSSPTRPRCGRGRLLGPGDGAALHFPLRAAVWESYRARRPARLEPGHLPGHAAARRLSPGRASTRPWPRWPLLPPFTAFQVLVLASLAASAAARLPVRAPAGRRSAWARSWRGLCFALGPVPGRPPRRHRDGGGGAAPAAAAPRRRVPRATAARRARAAGLAVTPRPAAPRRLAGGGPRRARAPRRAGSLVAHLLPEPAHAAPAGERPGRRGRARCWPRPSSLPTLLAARDAGRAVTGLASPRPPAARLLRPRPALRVAHARAGAGPGRAAPGPHADAGARPRRRAPRLPRPAVGARAAGRARARWPRLRPHAVRPRRALALRAVAGAARAARARACARTSWSPRWPPRPRCRWPRPSLGPAARDAGRRRGRPRPEPHPLLLARPLAAHRCAPGIWLLPLTVSFLLQPHGRGAWDDAPTRAELYAGQRARARRVRRAMGALARASAC